MCKPFFQALYAFEVTLLMLNAILDNLHSKL